MTTMTLAQFHVLDRTLDPEFGIIEQISRQGNQPCEAPVHYAVSIAQNPSAISPHSRRAPMTRPDRQAAGAGVDWPTCLWSAMGETLERYAAAIVDPARVRVCRRDALPGTSVAPDEFIGFSSQSKARPEFPFLRYGPETELAWTEAVRPIDNSTAYVPADMVWIPQAPGNPRRMDRGYSTGLGAHTSPHRAAATAIKELVERDAYIGRYLIGAPPPRLPTARLLAMLPVAIAHYIAETGLDLRVFDITPEYGVPAALCHIFPETGIASGASAAASPHQAVNKAVIEALHTLNWLVDMDRWKLAAEHDAIDDFIDHVTYHRRPEAAARYRSFADGAPNDTALAMAPIATSPRAEVRALVERLESAGFPVYLVDLTTPDLDDVGFHVVRAVIPGLQPMYAGVHTRHDDPRRLRQVAGWLGYPFRDDAIVAHPHPFP